MEKNIYRLIEKSSNLYPNKIFLRDINKKLDLTYETNFRIYT